MKQFNLAIAALFLGFSAFAQNTGKLNLTKGKTYQVVSKVQTDSKTNYQGQEMNSNADITTTYLLQITDNSNNQYKVNSTVKSMKMKMENMGQEMSYDSQDTTDSNNPLAQGMEEVLNKTIALTLDNTGKVIAGVDDSSVVAPMLKQMENSGYGTESAFISIPANVKVGDTWTDKREDSSSSNTVHYTVKAISGNVVTLSYTGDTKADMKLENQGMEINTKTQGTFTGQADVDKSGLVKSSKNDIKTSGTVSVMGQEFPTSSDTHTETTVTEVK